MNDDTTQIAVGAIQAAAELTEVRDVYAVLDGASAAIRERFPMTVDLYLDDTLLKGAAMMVTARLAAGGAR